jgi:hypothetical protein
MRPHLGRVRRGPCEGLPLHRVVVAERELPGMGAGFAACSLGQVFKPALEVEVRERALDLTAAATLLLQLGDAQAAEARLLAEPGRIDGNHCGSIVPLAKALRDHECPRGETVVYRALLRGILERAYARAYGHAARYWARLGEIAGSGLGLLPPLPSHEDFEAEIRARHGRKPAFWAYVNGTRRDRHDNEDDLTT